MKHAVLALAVSLLLSTVASAQAEDLSKAKALQQRIITLDTHLDTPANFSRPGWSILDHHHADEDGTQVDYPRMQEGLLDGGFWVVYTGQGPRTPEGNLKARDFGLKRLAEIREMAAANADKFEIATTADDAARIKKAGKKIVYISMENAYPLESDPSLLSAYYKLGLRMLSLVHTSNNDFADSSTDPKGPEWNGLSPKGKAMIAEANKLGIVLDQSHASDTVFDQMLELSKAPIILSHTAADAVNEHPRNIDDARIRKLAAKGGVIQVNSLSAYIIPTQRTPEYQAAARGLMTQFGGRSPRELTPAEFKQLAQQREALNAKFGVRRATFDDYMKHILHIIEVAGPDHVGLGADWDGGGGVTGLEDVSLLPKITQGLLDAGYTEAQIANVWGGNVIRLIGQVQAAADPDAVKAILD
ncbi:membrane dipeptidase [Pseudoxanthomonas sp. GM95]|uniref:dipeptidase n=1 Tax=Pseudoxanthomonas sp. GM95 TaxID=1881043 RepID=UPI0008C72DC1|nr:dipeptidase [Pseudoxanthomonas sp. GM95]SEL81898.1 membrane dipeptidase [Pseudoxanthomonas sp. GM95]